MKDDEPFAFAGIWEPAQEDTPETFAILTTEPNSLVGHYHHRMAVVLPGELMARWIGNQPLDDAEFTALTLPFPSERMVDREVSRYVNNSKHEGPECLGPPEPRPVKPPPDLELDLGL